MMKGNKARMEKLLHVLFYLGVTLFVAGTVTDCSIKDTKIKDAASKAEVPNQVQSQVNAEEELTGYNKDIEEELEKQEIKESTEDELNNELSLYWDRYKEVLAPFKEKGLTFEVFSDIYSLYRVGNEDVVSADDAYQLTYKEIERRYKETSEVDLSFNKNITKNSDGTYEYSEEFMTEIKKRPYFEGATDEEIIDFLDNTLVYFIGSEDSLDSEMMDSLLDAFDDGNLHEENITYIETETGQTLNPDKNNNNSNTTQSNQQPAGQPAPEPEIITEPNYTPNIGNDSPFSDAITGELGGGEIIIPDGFNVH